MRGGGPKKFQSPCPCFKRNSPKRVLSILDRRFVVSRTGTLTIRRVQYEDRGHYHCTATNSVGTVSASGRLYVARKFKKICLGFVHFCLHIFLSDTSIHPSIYKGLKRTIFFMYKATHTHKHAHFNIKNWQFGKYQCKNKQSSTLVHEFI